MFLTQTDLTTLTGYKQASKQIWWLKRHGLPFWLDRRGKAIVPVSAIEGRGKKGATVAEKDFSWLTRP